MICHRLVCDAFHPNPDNKPFVNHKDRVRTNNRASNLEHVTRQENATHAQLAGSFKNNGKEYGRGRKKVA